MSAKLGETQLAYAGEDAVLLSLDALDKYAGDERDYDFHGYTMRLPRERKFADLDSIRRYVSMVCSLPQVQQKFPGVTAPSVRERKGHRAAHYSQSNVEIAINTGRDGKWALREMVVLHELAHHLAKGDMHGATWRGCYIFLVEVCMGQEVAMILGASLFEHTGKPHKPVK